MRLRNVHVVSRSRMRLRFPMTIRATFLASLFAVLFVSRASAVEKRNITEKDLFNFVWIGDPQLSPDGSRVAFVRVSVNEKKEGYDTSLWVVSAAGGEEPHRLTTGTRDASPRWSPDGKYIAFVRTTEKEGKPEPGQLCMLPMTGGDTFQFTSLPKGAGGLVWSPDGKTIAFTSGSNPEDLAKAEKKKRKEEELKKASAEGKETPKPANVGKEDEGERESDIHVVTRAVYRSNNEGYLDPKRPKHIWAITAPRTAEEKVQPKQLTSGRYDEGEVLWSKDGSPDLFRDVSRGRALLRTAEDGPLFHRGRRRRAGEDHDDRDGCERSRVEPGWKVAGLHRLGE